MRAPLAESVTTVDWHTTEVENEIIHSLRRIVRAIDVQSRALSREFDLTWPQLAALRELERVGRCPVGQLAAEMYIGAPTLSGIVDRLEQSGLVQRMREDDDRRKVLVDLTDAGRRLLSREPSLLSEGVRRELATLPSEQQNQMLKMLKRLVLMLEPTPNRDVRDEQRTNGHGENTS